MQPAEDLRTSSDPQLQFLRSVSCQVETLRGAAEMYVSRSSLLYSAAMISPLVLTVFETNGLNIPAWERSLGIEERPSLRRTEPDGPPFLLASSTEETLMQYGSRWPQRSLDVLGIVAVICPGIDDVARRHVEAAGLNVRAAARQLVQLVDASPDRNVDFTTLDLKVSHRAAGIFEEARQLNGQFNVDYRALTASQVLLGAIADAYQGAATSFLNDYIHETVGERFDTVRTEWMAWYRKGQAEYDRWTQHLTAIVLRAQRLSQETRGQSQVAARHLVGALIASDQWAANSGVPEFLRKAEVDQRKLARAYFDKYLVVAPIDTTQPQRDNLDVWRRFLGLSFKAVVPRFNAEDLAGSDLLNITPDANAFASLVASKHIDPPLSIGLFGDWGSGKSFFMAKMREAINERAKNALGREASGFHDHIVQIEFNSWHYAEADLWASMVEHLFRNLKLTYEKPDDENVRERRDKLLEKLDGLMARKIEAEGRLKKAEIERERATRKLEAKEKGVDASAAAAQNIRVKDVWEMVQIDEADRHELTVGLKRLGIGRVLSSNADVRQTLEELRSVRTRVALLANWVAQQPALLVLLAIGLIIAPFIAMRIARLAFLDRGTYAFIAASVSQITALVGVVTAWVARRLAAGKKVLDAIDKSRERIDKRVADAAARIQKEVKKADAAVANAAGEVRAAQRDVASRENAVSTAKKDLVKLSQSYRLNRFIDERAASDDYRKLLGVLATVRNDFAMLSSLMHPPNGEKSDFQGEFHIDRIVLYIDDLDRCEPDRVIEVLQAVHLLLAFKLFVVVVGVDARWVSESLRQKHRALRGKRDVAFGNGEVVGYAVEPHDYLEKIFQVPFWLDPLQPKAAGSYIASLLEPDVETEVDSISTASGKTNGGAGSIEQISHTLQNSDDNPFAIGVVDRGIEGDPKQLTIDARERDYMKSDEIVNLVSRSPRTAKRFVNTYRFFRASIPQDSLSNYLDQGMAEYRCALLMLAIVVGVPDISLELFGQMTADADPGQALAVFVRKVTAGGDHAAEWKLVIDALQQFADREGVPLSRLRAFVERVSRYSFRPPPTLTEKNRAPKSEPLIRIKQDPVEPRQRGSASRRKTAKR